MYSTINLYRSFWAETIVEASKALNHVDFGVFNSCEIVKSVAKKNNV